MVRPRVSPLIPAHRSLRRKCRDMAGANCTRLRAGNHKFGRSGKGVNCRLCDTVNYGVEDEGVRLSLIRAPLILPCSPTQQWGASFAACAWRAPFLAPLLCSTTYPDNQMSWPAIICCFLFKRRAQIASQFKLIEERFESSSLRKLMNTGRSYAHVSRNQQEPKASWR